MKEVGYKERARVIGGGEGRRGWAGIAVYKAWRECLKGRGDRIVKSLRLIVKKRR